MGQFSDRAKGKADSARTTIIADGTRIVGELTLDVRLHVDGRIEGKIDSQNDISVGVSGAVLASVTARRIAVYGRVEGDVRCDALEILDGGQVRGKVISPSLTMEGQAIFNGDYETGD